MEPIRHRACPNPICKDIGKLGAGNIILHASFDAKSATRQRCLCKSCDRTFSANTGTAYAGLRCSRDEFDQVAAPAKRFSDEHLRRFEIEELQAAVSQDVVNDRRVLDELDAVHRSLAVRTDEDLPVEDAGLGIAAARRRSNSTGSKMISR